MIRLFAAVPLGIILWGMAVTVWWLAGSARRLAQHLRGHR